MAIEGLVVWPDSPCRSVLAFYAGLGETLGCPVIIYLFRLNSQLREKTGFSLDEFKNLNIILIPNDNQAIDVLTSHSTWLHLFGSYQRSVVHQKLINESIKLKIRYGIASEAPCNMHSSVCLRIVHTTYTSTILPLRLRRLIRHAIFLISYSGDYIGGLTKLGWKPAKIIPCGYYSPPISGSKIVLRGQLDWENFSVLLTGLHQWRRSPMLLMEAINILNKKGLKFKCNITQEGPLLDRMKKYALDHNLNNVHFLGLVPLDKLIELYENCSVFIGAGSHEPWGIRLNDALQCGSPLIVSEGMGGRKLVDDYKCGLIFSKDNPYDLAKKIENLILDKNLYLQVASNAVYAANEINPLLKAKEIAQKIAGLYEMSVGGIR